MISEIPESSYIVFNPASSRGGCDDAAGGWVIRPGVIGWLLELEAIALIAVADPLEGAVAVVFGVGVLA